MINFLSGTHLYRTRCGSVVKIIRAVTASTGHKYYIGQLGIVDKDNNFVVKPDIKILLYDEKGNCTNFTTDGDYDLVESIRPKVN